MMMILFINVFSNLVIVFSFFDLLVVL